MIIRHMQLHNFRNYHALDFTPYRALSVFLGDNAQGKTNLLEAVFFCAMGRSHRTAKDAEMILFGADCARINLEIQKSNYVDKIEIIIGQRKQIKINGKGINKIGDLLGALQVVSFSPEDMRLVKDTPAQRRRFMDMELSQMGGGYFNALQRYNRALMQRNALLREGNVNNKILRSFDKPLCEAAATVVWRRVLFLEQLRKIVKMTHFALSGEREKLEIQYLACANGDDEEKIQSNLMESLENSRDMDIRRATTCVGPHRDDIQLLLNGRDARAFASQGQQRTAALALKLSEIELMEKETGEKPILLLDDVMSELDEKRGEQLLDFARNLQTFLTATHLHGGAIQDAAVYSVENGRLDID